VSAEPEIEIRQIQAGDKLTGLSLGSAQFTPLKTFLQKHAKTYHQRNLARTYGAFVPVGEARFKIVGYITLVCGEVVVDHGEAVPGVADDEVDYRYLQYPAVKIARLAVDDRVQGRGLASAFVDLALGIAKDTICPAVGCRFVVVDSKAAAVPFYERRGFTLLDTEANRRRPEPVMFVDLYKTSA
jgi:GNAT superfamily N-acetyltransferase